METKKRITLSGVLMLPLSVGCRAFILHGNGYTRTSMVVAIHSVQPGDIRFETRNTLYRLLTPAERSTDCWIDDTAA